jgi:hypothetical protein
VLLVHDRCATSRLNGNQGLNVFQSGYPVSVQVDCATHAVITTAPTVTAGNSSLTYDPTTDTYTYVWKTDKSWAKTCRQLVMEFTDGSIHDANFTFPK